MITSSLPLLIALRLLAQYFDRKDPSIFSISLEFTDEGLIYKRPFRSPVSIPFAEIRKIVARSINGGDGESSTSIIIYSSKGRAMVPPELVYGACLIERLTQLPGWDSDAYRFSGANENSIVHSFFSKRTVLLHNA
jgi:hypothetical protein